MDMSKEVLLIKRLIRLTEEDKLEWKKFFFNAFECEVNGLKISTELIQDDKPQFYAGKIQMKGYEYGIEELNGAIYEYLERKEKRQKAEEEGQKTKKQKKNEQKQKREEKARELQEQREKRQREDKELDKYQDILEKL